MLSVEERHEVVRLITKELNCRDAEKKPLSEQQTNHLTEMRLNYYLNKYHRGAPSQPTVDANTVVLTITLIALACTLVGFVAGKLT
jgi:hypothetical protein